MNESPYSPPDSNAKLVKIKLPKTVRAPKEPKPSVTLSVKFVENTNDVVHIDASRRDMQYILQQLLKYNKSSDFEINAGNAGFHLENLKGLRGWIKNRLSGKNNDPFQIQVDTKFLEKALAASKKLREMLGEKYEEAKQNHIFTAVIIDSPKPQSPVEDPPIIPAKKDFEIQLNDIDFSKPDQQGQNSKMTSSNTEEIEISTSAINFTLGKYHRENLKKLKDYLGDGSKNISLILHSDECGNVTPATFYVKDQGFLLYHDDTQKCVDSLNGKFYDLLPDDFRFNPVATLPYRVVMEGLITRYSQSSPSL